MWMNVPLDYIIAVVILSVLILLVALPVYVALVILDITHFAMVSIVQWMS